MTIESRKAVLYPCARLPIHRHGRCRGHPGEGPRGSIRAARLGRDRPKVELLEPLEDARSGEERRLVRLGEIVDRLVRVC